MFVCHQLSVSITNFICYYVDHDGHEDIMIDMKDECVYISTNYDSAKVKICGNMYFNNPNQTLLNSLIVERCYYLITFLIEYFYQRNCLLMFHYSIQLG